MPALFVSLVLLMATKKKPWKTGTSSGHIIILEQSILKTLDIYGPMAQLKDLIKHKEKVRRTSLGNKYLSACLNWNRLIWQPIY